MDKFSIERDVVWTLYRNGQPVRNAQGQIAAFESEMEARKAAQALEANRGSFQSLTERAEGRPRSDEVR